MFERFTERARQVVVNAQDEARESLSPTINDGHLLLGLVHEAQVDSLAYKVLAEMGVHFYETKDFILDHTDALEEPVQGHLPFSSSGKKILELALREALSLGHNYIGTEHVLLGLVRENSGVSKLALDMRGVTPEKVRNEVIRMLSRSRQQHLEKQIPNLLAELQEALTTADETLSRIRQIVAV